MNVPVSVGRDSDAQIPFGRGELDRTITERFARIVSAQPAAVALSCDGTGWTYAELDAWTNRVAWAILARAATDSPCIAFLVDHGPAMVVSALAALKAGKAYVCIHAGLPAAAQREIVDDAAPGLLIVDRGHGDAAAELFAASLPVLRLEETDGLSREPVDACGEAGEPAVIVYTSGSTGRPKGVVKSHRAVLHRAWLCAGHDAVRPGDRQSLLTSCAFASSEADLFGALLNGAAVETYDLATRGLAEFGAWIDAQRITLLHPPVVLFRRYLESLGDGALHDSVRLVALAGETVIPSDVALWRRHFGSGCELRHRFSSTEAGHIAVACVGSGVELVPDTAPLPGPVRDKQLLVVDADGVPVRDGEEGELVVASRFLASGYWRRPDNQGGFEADPAGGDLRRFRTGDLVRLTREGRLVFLGRRDGQVKIRGYRVELREIEQELTALPEVAEAAVIAVSQDDENRLAAFLVARTRTPPDSTLVRARLRTRLPAWKVPGRIEWIESLPLTLTGKVDRQRLVANLTDRRSAGPAHNGLSSSDSLTRMTLIWEDILGRQRIASDESFFDLGGDSLLALRLLARVQQEFGRPLSLASLFAAPTIRGLTESSSGDARSTQAASVVRLNPGTTGQPLICLPTADGSVLTYLRLARLLATDHPLDAVQLDEDRPEQIPSFEAMAAQCVAAIRRARPSGPYNLCGYCYGGALAFEVARQLTSAGECVGLLAMIDTYVPHEPLHSLPLYRSLPRYLTHLLRASPRAALGDFAHRLRHSRLRPQRAAPTAEAARLAAFHRYRPLHYSGELTLLEAGIFAPHRMLLAGPADGWQAFCDRISSYSIAGDHQALLEDAKLAEIGTVLSACMNRYMAAGLRTEE